jgi:Phage integrase family
VGRGQDARSADGPAASLARRGAGRLPGRPPHWPRRTGVHRTAWRPAAESKFVPDRFKPAIAATNQAIAQLDPDGRPDPLPDDLRLYDLRHTAASLMIRQGASVKAVQRQLGHATASITLDTYGHLSPTSWTPWPALHGPSADQRSCPSGKAQVSEPIRRCRRRDSNPHALAGPTLLRRGCLPIPALRR